MQHSFFSYSKPWGERVSVFTNFAYNYETKDNIKHKIFETGKIVDSDNVVFKPTRYMASGTFSPPWVDMMEILVTIILPDGKIQNWKVVMNPGPMQGPLTAKSATLVP